jgi:hypothetical protein
MDRLGAGLTVRAGQALQVAMDLPGHGLARAAAATGAVVLALAAGLPVLGDVVDGSEDDPRRFRPAVVDARDATADADAGEARPEAPPGGPIAAAAREPQGRKTVEDGRAVVRASVPTPPTAPPAASAPGPSRAVAPAPTSPRPSPAPAPGSTPSPAPAPAPDSLDPVPAAPAEAPVPAPDGGALSTSIGP